MQINALQLISQTAIYKKWLKQNQSIKELEIQYKRFLKASPSLQGQAVTQAILQSTNKVKIDEIKNTPETPFHVDDPRIVTRLYQQPLVLIFTSTYFDNIAYLQYLEKALPNVRWESLDYEVMNYPMAKIQLQFAILYEEYHPNS